jgi:SPP1 gp7 family putative phage head morphogenesis protein
MTARAANPLRRDPTRTLSLRRRFAAELRRRFAALRREAEKAVVADDRWRFLSPPEKARAFSQWLRVLAGMLLAGPTLEQVIRRYVQEAYLRGAGRAANDLGVRPGPDPLPEQAPRRRREQFLLLLLGRAAAHEKVDLLAGRVEADLNGVVEAVLAAASRAVAHDLARGAIPSAIAIGVRAALDVVGRNRSKAVAEDAVIRAHAEGQLDAMGRLGVESVTAQAEWVTVGDDRVCPRCEAMVGTALPLAQARGLIPLHPGCRCAWRAVARDSRIIRGGESAP